MTQPEMTDEEVRQQIERTDAFIAAFRELIASTAVDPASSCEAACHRAGLERIAATVGAVDYISFCNLANVKEAMRGVLLDVLGVQLMCVGQGPRLDYADASGFLAELHQLIFNLWRQRHLH